MGFHTERYIDSEATIIDNMAKHTAQWIIVWQAMVCSNYCTHCTGL